MSIKVLDVVICQAIEPQIFVTTHPRSALQILSIFIPIFFPLSGHLSLHFPATCFVLGHPKLPLFALG